MCDDMYMALALEETEEVVRLPGELPPGFRRLHRHQPKLATAQQHSLCTSSADGLPAELLPKGLQDNQQRETDEPDGDLFKVINRLDDIIECLMKSCNVKPNVESHMDVGAQVAEPFNPRVFENRLDKIIQALSQGGYFSRPSKELYGTPPKVNLVNSRPSCYDTPQSSFRKSPLGTSELSAKANDIDQRYNPVTPTSSFRIPVLTPRSLLSKFGSSEKVDPFTSPPTNNRRLSSSGRSGRFSAAFSFLASPRRVGSALSFRVGSPKPSDGYSER